MRSRMEPRNTGAYERTDPDYNDKRMAKLVQDFKECPKDWIGCFVKGLTKFEKDYLVERGILKFRRKKP